MACRVLRVILGDQLDRNIAALNNIDAKHDVVLLMEVVSEATYVRHHKQKIAFLFSAMRHFAEELSNEGLRVDYVKLDDPANSGSFAGEVSRAAKRHRAKEIAVTEPGEWRVLQDMRTWEDSLGVPVDIRADDRFFCTRRDFRLWSEGRNSLTMEFFYRVMRKRTGFLMDGDAPAGGQWNFDKDNRKPLPKKMDPPPIPIFAPDAITRDVIALVEARFSKHFGKLEKFAFAVTREQALIALEDFVSNRLPSFGDYQDAMRADAPFLFHSILSPYINAGLLTPREVCDATQEVYEAGHVPLNAAEGFIRQILGWREYVRGIYWLKMPDYEDTNFLDAHRPLPKFFWTGKVKSRCLQQTILGTRDHAYAHHIQRLMVTGNYALIAGIEPKQVEEWYLIVYADAYDWVELPNVHGMILFADGGLLGTKPYAASGAYINKMSDYCGKCFYDVKQKAGEKACPFNYLYWDFMIRNREKLAGNHRMRNQYGTLDRMSETRIAEIQSDAKAYLDDLEPAEAGDY